MHFWKKRSDGLSREDIRLIKANCKQVVHQEELAIKRFEEAKKQAMVNLITAKTLIKNLGRK